VKHILIVSGGFAGLSCARELARSRNLGITFIDKNNYQQFQPLLYQLTTAALGPSNVAFNLRVFAIFRLPPTKENRRRSVDPACHLCWATP
jgi:NADH dehydrogenase FAD-containing subunit